MTEKKSPVSGMQEKIYGKEQQIEIIKLIMKNLCHKELSQQGREYLQRLIDYLNYEIDMLDRKIRMQKSH